MLFRRILIPAITIIILSAIIVILQANLKTPNDTPVLPSRVSNIPLDLTKIVPAQDLNPPKSYSSDYNDPVPVPGKVNTAGGEDSAFITPDGETLYFFFTPDVRVPVEKQVIDQVTGLYVSKKLNNVWQEPERLILQDSGKLALDGAEYVRGNTMYFCSAREGYTGIHWFKAEYIDGKWCNWVNVDKELKKEEYSVGELHITADNDELYFHSERFGGQGSYDIWVSPRVNGEWGEPVNLSAVNSAGSEGWPFVTEDGRELWFSKDYGIWRSLRESGEWQAPERVFFPLAGEPSMDKYGNLYFTHHFYKDNIMLEADIYVATRKDL